MSKKLKTQLIMFVVLAIWGNIGYRLFKNYQVEQELDQSQQVYNDPSHSVLNFRKDSFQLVLPETDPFLKTRIKVEHRPVENQSNQPKNSNVRQNKNTKNEVPKEKLNWPQIKYFGFVKNHENTGALCLIQINERMLKVSEGDQEAGVLVTGVFTDSVHLVFSGEERTFVKG